MHFASLTVVAPRVFSFRCGDFLFGGETGFSFGEDLEVRVLLLGVAV